MIRSAGRATTSLPAAELGEAPPLSAPPDGPGSSWGDSLAAVVADPPAAPALAVRPRQSGPGLGRVLLISYASAMTLACLWLVIRLIPGDVMAECRVRAAASARPVSRAGLAIIILLWASGAAVLGWIGYRYWLGPSAPPG